MTNISNSPAKLERKRSTQEIADRAKVFAARMRLQSTRDQADALDAIGEIAGNLIGTEQFAVFKGDKKR